MTIHTNIEIKNVSTRTAVYGTML